MIRHIFVFYKKSVKTKPTLKQERNIFTSPYKLLFFIPIGNLNTVQKTPRDSINGHNYVLKWRNSDNNGHANADLSPAAIYSDKICNLTVERPSQVPNIKKKIPRFYTNLYNSTEFSKKYHNQIMLVF